MHSFVTLAVSIALLPAACALTLLPGRPERAAHFLKEEGRRLGSTELLQLGNDVKGPGDLDKVKDMISNMIARHQATQVDDTSHKSFCDKEMVASKSKVEKLKTEIQKRNADTDLHTAQLAQLKDGIGDLHTEVANAHKDRMKAADLRSKEAATYEQNKQDWAKTLQTLKRQLRADSRKEREAAEKSEEEITLKQVKAENREEDAQFKFKKLDGELEVAVAKKTKEVEFKERKVVSMVRDLSLSDGDFKIAKEEMAAAQDYAGKIKTSCTVRQDPAKQRARARTEQITSLKEAYGILTGDGIPTYR